MVGLHHLPVRGVRHHEEQLGGALQGPGVSHLHLPARGLYPHPLQLNPNAGIYVHESQRALQFPVSAQV